VVGWGGREEAKEAKVSRRWGKGIVEHKESEDSQSLIYSMVLRPVVAPVLDSNAIIERW